MNPNIKYTLGISRPHSQFSIHSSLSDDGTSVHEEPEGTTTAGQLNEFIVTAKLSWYRRALASLTLYSELYAARTSEEFASVRMRFRQEWTFAIGVVRRSTVSLPDSADPSLNYAAHSPFCVSFSLLVADGVI